MVQVDGTRIALFSSKPDENGIVTCWEPQFMGGWNIKTKEINGVLTIDDTVAHLNGKTLTYITEEQYLELKGFKSWEDVDELKKEFEEWQEEQRQKRL